MYGLDLDVAGNGLVCERKNDDGSAVIAPDIDISRGTVASSSQRAITVPQDQACPIK